MQFGTARKPALPNSFAVQPSNLDGTLSHHVVLAPGPPAMVVISLRRKDSRTAFFSHWLTCQFPLIFSATRTSPASIRFSASFTASRTSPLVSLETESRASQASSIVVCNAAWLILDVTFHQFGTGRPDCDRVAEMSQPSVRHALMHRFQRV